MRVPPLYIDPLSRQLHALGHDLRAPLRNVEQALELLEAEEGKPDEDTLILMEQGVRWMRLMVDNMVEDAQLQAGRLPFDLDDLDLLPFLRGLAADMERLARRLEIRFVLECRCADIILKCDQVKLMRCLTNLFANALKHTQEGGQIIMEVSTGDHLIRICVIDSGSGLDPRQLRQVNKAINRRRLQSSLPNWSEVYGLSLVSSYVRRMKGRLELHSAPGAGTRASLVFQQKKTRRNA